MVLLSKRRGMLPALRRMPQRMPRALALAAAPTFAVMTLVTALAGASDMTCMGAQGMSLLGGMVPMYALMSFFHLPPWLNLACRRRWLRDGNAGPAPRSAACAAEPPLH